MNINVNWSWVRERWSEVPLLGPLANCSITDHKSALKEFTVILVFATVTFWLSALFLKALKLNDEASYISLLLSTVRSGELFIFSVAFLGPILVTAAEDPKYARQFPGRIWHFLALVFIALIAAGFYALLKIAQTQGLHELFNKEFLFDSSVIISVTAVSLRYLAIVYRKQTFNPEKELKQQEGNFADEFEQRHAGDQP